MNSSWLIAALLAWVGGLGIPMGGFLNSSISAVLKKNRTVFNHFMTALGGGALLSAVALVLVPDGMEKQNDYVGVSTFVLGGFLFLLLDRRMARSKGGGPQVVAMVSDFIPEAIALGAVFLQSVEQAYLLAGIMMIQNIPEGYNAFDEFPSEGSKKRRNKHTLKVFIAISILGPICAMVGALALAEYESLLGALMTTSAGGITYLIFRDIAPAANLRNNFYPSFGSILGFAVGLLGWSLVH